MKTPIIIAALALFLGAGCVQQLKNTNTAPGVGETPQGVLSTIEGKADLSKAGLVVDGVIITTIDPNEIDQYVGKYVRVRGWIEEDHPLLIEPGPPKKDEPIKQGFTFPLMRTVESIEIIETPK